jgi:hypothetical protein
VWQWHNGLPILFVAVAQWLADLIVWQWHNGLLNLDVVVSLVTHKICSSINIYKQWHNDFV